MNLMKVIFIEIIIRYIEYKLYIYVKYRGYHHKSLSVSIYTSFDDVSLTQMAAVMGSFQTSVMQYFCYFRSNTHDNNM